MLSLRAGNGPQFIEIPPCWELSFPLPPHPPFPGAMFVAHGQCPLIGSVWTCFTSHMHDEVEEVGLEKEKPSREEMA